MPLKCIIDFLSLHMVGSLKEVPEGVENGQSAKYQSGRAYPLSLEICNLFFNLFYEIQRKLTVSVTASGI